MPKSPAGASPHERLIRKLETIGELTRSDRLAIERLPVRVEAIEENADVVQEGDRPSECFVVVEGLIARYKVLGAGQRQIFSYHLPGDIPDVQSLHLKTMDHSMATLTPCRIGFIPHSALYDLLDRNPTLAALFWRDTLIDAAIFREWLAGVGRRSAHQRIAHLFCEVYCRLKSLGLAEAWHFELPITQIELADSLGLSSVHVNRVLQDLRREGLIASHASSTQIKDWSRLKAAGDFDPAYLHLCNDPQV